MHILAEAASDPSWFVEILKASPGLAVAVYLVVIFLRAMAKRDDLIERISTANTAAINRNSETLGRVSECFDNQRTLIADAVRDGIERAA